MRLVLIILVLFHGIIHLFGFLKAFKLAEMEALTQNVSKPIGVLWLIVFMIWMLSMIMLLIKNNYWLIGIIAVVLSQRLIVLFWQDAKFGTIPNVILLLVFEVGGANFAFKNMVKKEVSQMHANMVTSDLEIVSKQMIGHLPSSVKNWLNNSGIVGHEMISSMHIKQDVLMKLKPKQKEWYTATVDQYNTTHPPVFNWNVDMQMNPLMSVTGRDKFDDGKGAMLIKAFSIFPVVDVKETTKVNQAVLQRFLAEIVWYPSAVLSNYIAWEAIDDQSAKATMSHKGITGSGIFHFDENGDVSKFTTMRYMGMDDNATLEKWVVEIEETKVMNDLRIPTQVKVFWELEDENWTWLKIKVTDVEYDLVFDKVNFK